MKCIVGNGKMWTTCPDHINGNGKHGTGLCKWAEYETHEFNKNVKKWWVPEYKCLIPKHMVTQFTDMDFLL